MRMQRARRRHGRRAAGLPAIEVHLQIAVVARCQRRCRGGNGAAPEGGGTRGIFYRGDRCASPCAHYAGAKVRADSPGVGCGLTAARDMIVEP